MTEPKAVYKARRSVSKPADLSTGADAAKTPEKAVQRKSAVQMDLFDGRRKRRAPIIRTPEHLEQVALMQWAATQTRKYPDLDLLHAIPNGGHRFIAVAKAMKAEGVKSGVPDLHLPVARGAHHGLWIEMKAKDQRTKKGGGLSAEQRQWINRLTQQGYQANVCYGWDEARTLILGYLALPFINAINPGIQSCQTTPR